MQQRTLVKRRHSIFGFWIWVGIIQGNGDGNDMLFVPRCVFFFQFCITKHKSKCKRTLKTALRRGWNFIASVIVKSLSSCARTIAPVYITSHFTFWLQHKWNSTHVIKLSFGCIINQRLIHGVHRLRSDTRGFSNLPIIRIVIPKNGSESQPVSNGTNAIVNITKRRLCGPKKEIDKP